MNEIRHHISDDLLMAHSAGALAEGFDLVVATHLSLCDECRARVGEFDAIGGAILDEASEAEMARGSLEATLALIAQDPPADRPRAPGRAVANGATPGGARALPFPLRDYVGGGLDAVRWRRMGSGVRQAVLPTGPGATVRLLSIPGGARMPDHGHRGLELTLVLKGAFHDEFDRFARGDVEIANETDQHTPAADEGMDCICLVANNAPLRFAGLLPRIAQPFLRI